MENIIFSNFKYKLYIIILLVYVVLFKYILGK